MVLEKTPSNSLCVDVIDRVCPRARFLHIVRDPRHVMASLRDASAGWGAEWAPSNAAAAAHEWLKHFEGARRAASFGPDRYLEVRYEHLRADPVDVISDILAFLRLPDSAAALVDTVEGRAGTTGVAELVFKQALSLRLQGVPTLEPAGFRSTGRRPLSRSALRAAEVVLGPTARAAGYRDDWDDLSPIERRLWLGGVRVGTGVERLRDYRRRVRARAKSSARGLTR